MLRAKRHLSISIVCVGLSVGLLPGRADAIGFGKGTFSRVKQKVMGKVRNSLTEIGTKHALVFSGNANFRKAELIAMSSVAIIVAGTLFYEALGGVLQFAHASHAETNATSTSDYSIGDKVSSTSLADNANFTHANHHPLHGGNGDNSYNGDHNNHNNHNAHDRNSNVDRNYVSISTTHHWSDFHYSDKGQLANLWRPEQGQAILVHDNHGNIVAHMVKGNGGVEQLSYTGFGHPPDPGKGELIYDDLNNKYLLLKSNAKPYDYWFVLGKTEQSGGIVTVFNSDRSLQ